MFHLLKSDPDTYSWADLERDGKTAWDGVRNNTALLNLKKISVGDDLLIYHSGGERTVVGLAKCIGAARLDPTDEKGKAVLIDLEAVRKLKKAIPLADFKARFPAFDLVRISRLSVMPVPIDVEEWLADKL